MSVEMEKAVKRDGVSEEKKGIGALKRFLDMREASLLLILAAAIIGMAFATDKFLTAGNIRVMFQGLSVDMMIAVPMCIALIGGHIDFSVGSTLCLTAQIIGILMNKGIPVPVSIAAGLICGIILGVINAFVINEFEVMPLVVTLGTWMAYRGLAYVVSNSITIANLPDSFKNVGRVEPFGVPISIIIMLVIVIIGWFCLQKVGFFHQAFFIGSNKASARLAGINIKKFLYAAYALCGLVAALAGMLLTARLGSASQNLGQGLEFRVVVALLVGGISFDGGEGSIIGAFLGVVFMALVSNALVLLNVNVNYTNVIVGAILIISVAVEQANKKRKLKIS